MQDQPPIRDTLLMKCKAAIEELHCEVDRLQNENREIATQSQLHQREADRLGEKLKFTEREQQRLQDEISRWKQKATQNDHKVEYLEEQLRQMEQQQDRFEEMRSDFTVLADQNNQLKQQLDEALMDIQEKNQLRQEWDHEIDTVMRRIQEFQTEIKTLEKEKSVLEDNIQHFQEVISQQEVSIKQLNEKLFEYQQRDLNAKKASDLQRQFQTEMDNSSKEIDRLKKTIEQMKFEAERQVTETERQYSRKIQEIQLQLNREREQIRDEAVEEVEKLQRMADSLQSDIDRARQDKERLQSDLYETRDALLQKEYQLKEARDEYKVKIDQVQQHSFDELKKLQNIIDDQSELIHSYERVVEREKDEVSRRLEKVGQGEIKYKEQIMELTNKNSFLQSKLQDCQLELQKIQGEVNHMFQQEEMKNQTQMRNLEYQIEQYSKLTEEKEREISKLRDQIKKQKADQLAEKSFRKENFDRDLRIEELERERMLRMQEFEHMQLLLQRKIDDLMIELELERKKKMTESRFDGRVTQEINSKLDDKIKNIEDYYKQEIDYLKNELLRKERDFDQIKNKYDVSVQKILTSRTVNPQNHENTHNLSHQMEDHRIQRAPPYFSNKSVQQRTANSFNHQDKYDKYDKYSSEVSYNKSDTDKSYQEPERDRRKKTPQSTHQKGSKKESEFLSKFQNVISRMENKLEKMQSELNIEAKPPRKRH